MEFPAVELGEMNFDSKVRNRSQGNCKSMKKLPVDS
jgi:hypothetical protein